MWTAGCTEGLCARLAGCLGRGGSRSSRGASGLAEALRTLARKNGSAECCGVEVTSGPPPKPQLRVPEPGSPWLQPRRASWSGWEDAAKGSPALVCPESCWTGRLPTSLSAEAGKGRAPGQSGEPAVERAGRSRLGSSMAAEPSLSRPPPEPPTPRVCFPVALCVGHKLAGSPGTGVGWLGGLRPLLLHPRQSGAFCWLLSCLQEAALPLTVPRACETRWPGCEVGPPGALVRDL